MTHCIPSCLTSGQSPRDSPSISAAHELRGYPDFSVNAGGDIVVRGRSARREPWRVGIKDPRAVDQLVDVLAVSDAAICTSGDYERPRSDGAGHHIMVPTTGQSAAAVASVTVIAETAMVADALATAAFVLGPERGIAFLEAQGVDGIIVRPSGTRVATDGIARYRP